MFCEKCGKELIGNTKICTYCGSEQTSVVIPPASAAENSLSGTAQYTSAANNFTSTAPEAAIPTDIPTPVTIPKTNLGAYTPPTSITVFPDTNARNEKSASVPKYTLKHLVMCLAAAAVMAIAAGVFAGLYFAAI